MRLIDADAFFNDFPELKNYEHASQEYEVDAEPVKHGHWVVDEDGNIKCSECGHCGVGDNYCERCGAKMEDGDETN